MPKKKHRMIDDSWGVSQDRLPVSIKSICSTTPTALGVYLVVLPDLVGRSGNYVLVHLDRRLRWTESTLCPTKDVADKQKKATRKWHKDLAEHQAKKLVGKAKKLDYERILRLHHRRMALCNNN